MGRTKGSVNKNGRYEECKKLASQYETAAQLRKENYALYARIWRNGYWDVMPKGKNFSKNTFSNSTDLELIEMAQAYRSKSHLKEASRGLWSAMMARGLAAFMPDGSNGWNEKKIAEHFEKHAFSSRSEARKVSRSAVDWAIKFGFEHLLPPIGGSKQPKKAKKETLDEPEYDVEGIVPSKFRKGNRKGPYACFRAEKTESGFLCGRCRKEYGDGEHHRLCKDLCHRCFNDKAYSDMGGDIELNILGNVKDQYCHIVLNLDDGPMYIGIEVSPEEKKKIAAAGYGFLLK